MSGSKSTCIFSLAVFVFVLWFFPGNVRSTEVATLELTVRYTGSGEVNAHHGLVVVLFDNADFRNPATRILGMRYLTENDTSARFTDLASERIFVFATYDENGGYTGIGGPPGPIGFIAGDDGAPAPVSVREDPRVTLTFDDANRLPGSQVPSGPSSETLAAVEGGIVEIRKYKIKPGQRDRFVELFEKNLGHQVEHGLRVVGQFRSLDDDDTFVWILAFKNQEERLHLSRTHYFSPHWLNSRRFDVADLLVSTEVIFVEPTALSFLR